MEKMPVFVKLDEYKELVKVLEETKEKLVNAKELLSKIEELKRQEDAELESWNTEISEAEERIDDVDKILLKPEQ
ncbi:MAG: hypothetical protein AABX39_01920 [Nanoarchaeota archaeon]